MRKVLVVAAAITLGGLMITAVPSEARGERSLTASLNGYQEVPAVSSSGAGTFTAKVSQGDDSIPWTLSYSDLQGSVTQAHIHFGQPDVNGGISVFLCTNLGNGPAGTQPCPPPPATISGTITAADVIGPTGQGIAAGELGELLAAIRSGVTYANVHSNLFPTGEIRCVIE